MSAEAALGAARAPRHGGEGRTPVFHRVVLKLGGEALLGDSAYGIDQSAAVRIAAPHLAPGGAGVCAPVEPPAGRRIQGAIAPRGEEKARDALGGRRAQLPVRELERARAGSERWMRTP